MRKLLPELNMEIGDTWSYGIQSDPRKVANVRAAMRHRAQFEQQRQHPKSLPSSSTELGGPFTWWSNFSRCLLKGFEHTWGLRYDMCYGGGFKDSKTALLGQSNDPDNPNEFPYNDIPVSCSM